MSGKYPTKVQCEQMVERSRNLRQTCNPRNTTLTAPEEYGEMMIAMHEDLARVRAALKKVSPWVAEGGSYECGSCGQLIVDEPTCCFCGNTLSEGHSEDCKYKELTA